MSGLWNFLFSFSFDRSLTSYSVDELNVKLKELDLDKHLDSLEKAFEVQKTIIDKLKQENDLLKKELRDLKSKYNENKPEEVKDKVPYPELKTVLCYVKWSGLENNAFESRVVDQIRQRLVAGGIELEVQPWAGDRPCIQPLLIFFPKTPHLASDVDRVMQGFMSKILGSAALIVTNGNVDESSDLPSDDLLRGLLARCNVKLVIDLFHQSRRFTSCSDNEEGIKSIVSFIQANHTM